jgi:hypothetical protein
MVCEGATCRPETHIRPKSEEVPNHFSQPRYVHVHIVSYPMPTSGCPSSLLLPPSIFHSLSPQYLSTSHLPPSIPPRSTSPPSHYTSALACVPPMLSSVSLSIYNYPPIHIPPDTPYRVRQSLRKQPRLLCGFPVSIQLRSRRRMLRLPHLTSANLTRSILEPNESFIKVVGGG